MARTHRPVRRQRNCSAARRRRLAFEGLEDRTLLASFVVDSLGDLGDANATDGVPLDSTGKATLRAVIEHINRIGDSHTIAFAVSGTIALESSLPDIGPTVDIDGTGSDGKRVQLGRAATAPSNLIGALAFQGAGTKVRNLALGSIALKPGASNSRVEGNYVGVSRDGLTALSGGGILVQSSNNMIGGTTAATRNVASGISVNAGGNRVLGNHVGVTADGTAALAGISNILGGIRVTDGADNTIGGLGDGEFNVVGGIQYFQGDNFGAGIFVGGGNFSGTPRNTIVVGNRVGTNRDGTAAIPNRVGIQVTNVNATELTLVADNIVSGNLNQGIDISAYSSHTTTNVRVTGNKIGLSSTGAALGNRVGIVIAGASGNTIGGEESGQPNFIAANGPTSAPYNGVGVAVLCTGLLGAPCDQFSHDNQIVGNVIGSPELNNPSLGNTSVGIFMSGGNLRNRIDFNFILENGGSGVYLFEAERTTIVRNRIFRNRGAGVSLVGNSHDNVIGGTEAGAGNGISSNAYVGVTLFASGGVNPTRNAILGNSIADNGFLGIDLGNNNQSLNDLGDAALCPTQPAQCPDADTGANALQNAPDITRLSDQSVRVVLDSVPNTRFRIELFSNVHPDPTGYGEGLQYLEAFEVTTNSAGHASRDHALAQPLGGKFVAGTATRIENGEPIETSEFSGSQSFVVNSTLDLPDNNPGDGKIEIGAPGNVRRVTVNGQPVGMVTLRAALMEANALAGAQLISFSIPSTDAGLSDGVYTIRPAVNDSAVNQEDVTAADVQFKITDTVFIDATTQPGFDSVTRKPIIRLDGSSSTAGDDGLQIQASGSALRGFVINRFRGDAIDVVEGDNNVIAGNYLGLYASGDAATAPDGASMRNGGYGVFVHAGSKNVIGGSSAESPNVIAGNLAGGVRIDGRATEGDNEVWGNRIGVDRTGTAAVPNGSTTFPGPGVHVHGGRGNSIGISDFGNLISGNTGDGVLITGGAQDTSVDGNLIGLDATGQLPLGNGQNGLRVGDAQLGGATNSRIGSLDGNTISANRLTGVYLRGADVLNNVVDSNRIGTNREGNSSGSGGMGSFALGNQQGGVRIEDARNTQIGQFHAPSVIAGNGSHGVLLLDTTPDDALDVNAQVQLNQIGVSFDGRTPLGNDGDGVRIEHARHVVVGGRISDGNVISGNSAAGVRLIGYTRNNGDNVQHVLVAGNYIGTDATGLVTGLELDSMRRWGNAYGIVLEDSSGNSLGYSPYDSVLSTDGDGNVIAGNQDGIQVLGATASGNRIAGNRIGVDKTGLVALADQSIGVLLEGRDNVVGGTTVLERNIIAGSSAYHVALRWREALGPTPQQNNRVIGNFIGVDVTGQRSLGTTPVGVDMHLARGNWIGGAALDGERRSEANIIGGFQTYGVAVRSQADFSDAANHIVGNYIGVAANGTSLCGAATCASGDGIYLSSSRGNVIGGTTPAEGNVIAYNGGVGVNVRKGWLSTTDRNAILGNSIYANGRLGIDLETPVEDAAGVSHDTTEVSNDAFQANRNQRAPTLEVVDRDPQTARVTVTGVLNSAAHSTYRIEVFASQAIDPTGYGEGERQIHVATVTTDGQGRVPLAFLTDGSAGSAEHITATATKLADVNGQLTPTNTSEFSNSLQLGAKVIRGIVYLDDNGNARRDPGNVSEKGIAGWSVRLIKLSTNEEVGSQLTLADGSYRFPITETGDYRVETESRVNWMTTTGRNSSPPDSVRFTVDETPTPSVDFGKFARMKVEGEVFEDLNVDGDRDPGEPLVTGPFTVQVDLPGTESDRQRSLAASATFSIDQIGPGAPFTDDPHIDTELDVAGNTFLEVDPKIVSTPVKSGHEQVIKFAVIRPMRVEVQVFHDLNGDGVRQASSQEDLIDAWTVELDLNADGTSDAPGPGTTSGGQVVFSNVGIGDPELAKVVTVRVGPQVGWSQTTTAPVWNMASGGTFQAVIGQTKNGEIHGFKFEDLDADGAYNDADRPLDDVTFRLFSDLNRDGVPDAQLASEKTGPDGVVSFTDLPPGQYVVAEVVPTTAVATVSPTAVIEVRSGESVMAEPGLAPLAPGLTSVVNTRLSFGNFFLGAIHGYKFNDLDGQGIDNGDPRVAGITLTLRIDADENGIFETTRTSTTADPLGYYSFTNLGPGRYQVVESVPEGQAQTTTAPPVIDLRSGEVWVAQGGMAPVGPDQVQVLSLALAFGNFTRVDLSGKKYLDRDADGVFDPGEPGLAGWTIELDLDNDGTVDRTAVTASDGSYAFRTVGPGTHALREVQRLFFAQTAPSGGRHLVTTESGRDVGNLHFGDRTFQSVIAGTVYHDLDRDGVRDDDDPRLAGVIVYLDANNDGRLNHETPALDGACGAGSQEICWITDDSGEYAFPMPVGTYVVRQIEPAGWRQTQPGNPGFYAVDVFVDGETLVGYDFGNQRLAGAIHGVLETDLTGDGTSRSEWTGQRVGLTLRRETSPGTFTAVAEILSETSGEFHFLDVPGGTYDIVTSDSRLVPHRWSELTIQTGEVWMAYEGQATTAAGATPVVEPRLWDGVFFYAEVRGYVFDDLDLDGFDTGEPRTPGMTVLLEIDADGDEEVDDFRTATTNERGEYRFDQLVGQTWYAILPLLALGHVTTTPLPNWFQALSGDVWLPDESLAGTLDTYQFTIADPLLAVGQTEKPWTNSQFAIDVNGDEDITSLDALLVINQLNEVGGGPLPSPADALDPPPPYLDVSGDGLLTSLDALLVINYLNEFGGGPIPGGEGEASPFGSPTPWTFTPREREEVSVGANLHSPVEATRATVPAVVAADPVGQAAPERNLPRRRWKDAAAGAPLQVDAGAFSDWEQLLDSLADDIAGRGSG